MIKKSIFENELIAGMQRELRPHDKKQGMNNLVKAAEYLHSAMDIFEEAGLTSKADKVLRILGKIAAFPYENKKDPSLEVEWGSMPPIDEWNQHGASLNDLKEYRSNHKSKAKVNRALKGMGFSKDRIAKLLGHKNVMSDQEIKDELFPGNIGKIYDWMQNPTIPVDPNRIEPGEALSFNRMASPSDKHTKGLTPDKMVKNIKQHGHPMNLADDNFAADLLNADIDDNVLEVTDEDLDKTFEDGD